MTHFVPGFARPALAAALFGFALTASAQTEIQFWHSMTGALGDRVGDLAKRFNESQKDYKVVPVFKGTYPESMAAMVARSRAAGMSVRAGVQVAFGCAFDGPVERGRVVSLARRFLAMGIDELSLADSAGLGNPQLVRRVVQEILPPAGSGPVVLHLHHTRGAI